MSQQTAELTPKTDDITDDFHETAAVNGRWFCCFSNFRSCSNWERISTSGREQQQDSNINRRWWYKRVDAFKKAREWSELVAGPKWKTFIRRFKKRAKPGRLNYDAMSYSLNFDEGRSQNGNSDPDTVFRGFTSRYAPIPDQNGLSKDAASSL